MAVLSEKQRKRGLVLAMGGLGGLVMLDETILGVSLPAIRSELNLSPTTAHWIINSYMIAITCFAAVGGKAIDLFGLRPALISSGAVFAAASLLAGFSDSVAMLISMRVLQGLCAAIMFPMTLAAATLTFDENERGRAIGTLVGMASIFLAAGPMLGGALTDFLSWRWVFWINVPIVIAGSLAASVLWRNPKAGFQRPIVDKIGLVLMLIGLTALIFGLMEGPDFGWAAPVIIGCLAGGVIGIGAFVAYEARQANPLIDVRLFRLRPFHASVQTMLVTQMSKIVVAIFVPQFLQQELHISALWAGVGTAVAVLPFPFLSVPAGKFADSHGSRLPLLVGMSFAGLACIAMGGLMFFKSYWAIAPALLLWGVMMPYSMVPTGRITANAVPKEKQGEVSGLVVTARLIGGTFGVTLGSVLLAMNFGFPEIFWVMGALILICCAYGATAFAHDAPVKQL